MKKILFYLILAFLAYKAEGQTYKIVNQEIVDLQKDNITVADVSIYIHKVDSVYYFSENPDPIKPKYQIRDTEFYGKTDQHLIFRCCGGIFLLKFKYI